MLSYLDEDELIMFKFFSLCIRLRIVTSLLKDIKERKFNYICK